MIHVNYDESFPLHMAEKMKTDIHCLLLIMMIDELDPL